MLSLETGEWNPVVYSLQVCTKLAWCLCSVVWAFVPFYVTVLTETIWRHVKETLGNVICTFKHKHLYHNSPLPDFCLSSFLQSPPSHSDTDSSSKRNKNSKGNWTVTPFPLVVSASTCSAQVSLQLWHSEKSSSSPPTLPPEGRARPELSPWIRPRLAKTSHQLLSCPNLVSEHTFAHRYERMPHS